MREQAKEFRDKLKKECDNSELTFDQAIELFNKNEYLKLKDTNYLDLTEGISCIVEKVFIAPKDDRGKFLINLENAGENNAYQNHKHKIGWCCMCKISTEKSPIEYDYCGFVKYCLDKAK